MRIIENTHDLVTAEPNREDAKNLDRFFTEVAVNDREWIHTADPYAGIFAVMHRSMLAIGAENILQCPKDRARNAS